MVPAALWRAVPVAAVALGALGATVGVMSLLAVFPSSVERWRWAARDAAQRHQVPEGLILATIKNESEGIAGKPGRSGERGLMQVMPSVLASYNRENLARQVSWETMAGKDDAAGADQVAVGTWFIAHLARQLHQVNGRRWPGPEPGPWPDDQILHADLAFAAGFGGMQSHRAAAVRAGYADTFAGLEAAAVAGVGPRGKTGELICPPRKFGHARRALAWTRKDQGGEAPAPAPLVARSSSSGIWIPFAVALGLILLQPAKIPPPGAYD